MPKSKQKKSIVVPLQEGSNRFWEETPPKPITRAQYNAYLVGKHVGERGAFVPFTQLVESCAEQFLHSYRIAKRYLDNHPEIRRRRPSKQRLEVHAGDWFDHLAQQLSYKAASEAAIEASSEAAIEEAAKQRKAKAERNRRAK